MLRFTENQEEDRDHLRQYSMHAAQTFLTKTVFPNGSVPKNPPTLTASQVNILNDSLNQDATSYAYSGIITLSEAIIGADHRFYSWATIKAYYSVFYFLRAILAMNGTAIFYYGKKPWIISSRLGEKPKKGDNNTHEMVLSEFRKSLSAHWLLTQPIDSTDPLRWIKTKRECANYTAARFIEPNTPDHFIKISSIGIRKAVASYFNSENDLLAFDIDHAILAYPIQSLIHTTNEIKKVVGDRIFGEDDVKFLSTLCRDKNGPMSDFKRLFL